MPPSAAGPATWPPLATPASCSSKPTVTSHLAGPPARPGSRPQRVRRRRARAGPAQGPVVPPDELPEDERLRARWPPAAGRTGGGGRAADQDADCDADDLVAQQLLVQARPLLLGHVEQQVGGQAAQRHGDVLHAPALAHALGQRVQLTALAGMLQRQLRDPLGPPEHPPGPGSGTACAPRTPGGPGSAGGPAAPAAPAGPAHADSAGSGRSGPAPRTAASAASRAGPAPAPGRFLGTGTVFPLATWQIPPAGSCHHQSARPGPTLSPGPGRRSRHRLRRPDPDAQELRICPGVTMGTRPAQLAPALQHPRT